MKTEKVGDRHRGRDNLVVRSLFWFSVFAFYLSGLALFSSSGKDDSHIAYWPAYTLAQFSEILNYNGQRVEQASSLPLVLTLALARCVTGVALPTLGPILSILFGAICLILVYRLTLKVAPAAAPAATLLTAGLTYFVYWSASGMEGSLAALACLLLILSFGSHAQRRSASGIRSYLSTFLPGLFFALVRPESPLVLVCVLLPTTLDTMFRQRTGRKQEKGVDSRHFRSLRELWLLSLTGIALVFGFKVWYFGSLFPQPVYAKSGPISFAVLEQGIDYLWTHLLAGKGMQLLTPICLIALLRAAWSVTRNRVQNVYVLLTLSFLLAYAAFAILSGGDWMEGARFLVPVLPLGAMLLAVLLYDLPRRSLRVFFLAFLVLCEIAVTRRFVARISSGMPVWQALTPSHGSQVSHRLAAYSWFERSNRIHLRDIPVIDQLDQIVGRILSHKNEKILLFGGQMGMVPFHLSRRYFGQISFVDRGGLVERSLTDCPVTAGLPRRPGGLSMSWDFFADVLPELRLRCDFKDPDIIFDLASNRPPLLLLHDMGYTVLYKQSGQVILDSEHFAGTRVPAGYFIAVKDTYLPVLGAEFPIEFEFPRLL